MIEVTFYNNGFEINGHAEPKICYQVSILAWAFSNLVMDTQSGYFYTADYDNSNVGYTHFTFDPIEGGERIINRLKAYLEVWGEHYRWIKDGHIKVFEKDEILVIPDNFKELKGISIND